MSNETAEFGDQLELVIDELHELEGAIDEVLSKAQDMKHDMDSLFSEIRSNDGEVHEVNFESELDSIEDIMSDISFDSSSIEMAVARVRDAKQELDQLADSE